MEGVPLRSKAMALLTIEGRYRDGRVELSQTPEGIADAPVIVTFLTASGSDRDASVVVEGSDAGNGVETNLASVGDDAEVKRQEAVEWLLARMQRGVNLGGGPYYRTREEIYDDRLERLDPGTR
jgi:hypothetical protein